MPEQTVLLDATTKAILEKARYTLERTNIPNEHKALAANLELLKGVSQELGIALDEAGYTFTVVKKEKFGTAIYSPYVGSFKGQACIFWGTVRKPIDELSLPGISIEAVPTREGQPDRIMIEFELENYAPLRMTLMLPKDNPADRNLLRKALRAKELGAYLVKEFEKPRKLKELEPGTYTVLRYKETVFAGQTKYMIEIEGEGMFNANTKMASKLSSKPEISPHMPATLVIGESTEVTSSGHPIIPADLITVADEEIEQFDF